MKIALEPPSTSQHLIYGVRGTLEHLRHDLGIGLYCRLKVGVVEIALVCRSRLFCVSSRDASYDDLPQIR